jgi:hypothetical protein
MDTTTEEKSSTDIADKDIPHIIEKIQQDLEEFDNKANDVCKKTGMNKEQLEKYVNNPSNFSAADWSILQKVRIEVEDFQKKIWDALDKNPEDAIQMKKENDSKAKARRIKGRYKKNWIPMT